MVGLLDVDPDLRELLSLEERLVADKLRLRVHKVLEGGAGTDVGALLEEVGAFGAIIVEGMLVHRLRVADRVGLRLLGAGDIVMRTSDARLMVLAGSELQATPESRLALLDDAVLFAVRRWPTIAVRLLERFADQSQTLAAQFVIGQLPRVDQRLLALMWLLAERWGRVTTFGTRLPLNLTHGTLGALIGARRPTVTLALRELADRGALVKQPQGWLLIEPPGQPAGATANEDVPTLRHAVSGWQKAASREPRSRSEASGPAARLAIEQRQSVRAAAAEQRRRAAIVIDRSRKLRGES